MSIGKSRQRIKRSNNTKTPRKGAVSSIMDNKRRKNGKCLEGETINHRKKNTEDNVEANLTTENIVKGATTDHSSPNR
ncbi:hypothetical protein H5410_003057 [Solanum commersonii]|uniref:Uncharacterized protein n=1 Tax=Solanum commersonii TaxID=4109 RepID=A0A9J6B3Y4_SOLCO|nr:hypothetical protein H5410_003057 [Solanum commersonii]